MTETAQSIPDLPRPSQENKPHFAANTKYPNVLQPQQNLTTTIEEVYGGPAGQLSTAAHHLSMRGV
jgi:Mn-containing catalase